MNLGPATEHEAGEPVTRSSPRSAFSVEEGPAIPELRRSKLDELHGPRWRAVDHLHLTRPEARAIVRAFEARAMPHAAGFRCRPELLGRGKTLLRKPRLKRRPLDLQLPRRAIRWGCLSEGPKE